MVHEHLHYSKNELTLTRINVLCCWHSALIARWNELPRLKIRLMSTLQLSRRRSWGSRHGRDKVHGVNVAIWRHGDGGKVARFREESYRWERSESSRGLGSEVLADPSEEGRKVDGGIEWSLLVGISRVIDHLDDYGGLDGKNPLNKGRCERSRFCPWRSGVDLEVTKFRGKWKIDCVCLRYARGINASWVEEESSKLSGDLISFLC